MSGDEALVLVGSAVLAFPFWKRFYGALDGVSPLYRNARQVRLLGALPVVLTLLLLGGLLKWADPVVQGSVGYLLLFMFVGVLWMSIALKALPYFGLSWRDDVVEANNPAATLATCGALVGTMLSFGGSNVGSGPTIWTTLGPAVMTLGVFFAAWWLLEAVAHPSEAIAIERDPSAAAVLAGFLSVTGAILGFSAAGDWESLGDTFGAIAQGGVAVLGLLAVTAFAHRKMRPAR
jgi:uncharacterized membrane protein YjfL (UPF0719 family)